MRADRGGIVRGCGDGGIGGGMMRGWRKGHGEGKRKGRGEDEERGYGKDMW